jgi:hypothetical protein
MKTYRATSGPLAERLYLESSEIEKICRDELQGTGLLPSKPEPIRIDRFIEKRFGVTHSYEDLPEAVLGFTRFGPKGVEAVIVSTKLEEGDSAVAERRVRSTLAHEGGHGLLHAHLFGLSSGRQMFADYAETDKPKVLCREGATVKGYKGHWWEHQANRAIGSLLLPKSLVEIACEGFMRKDGKMGLKTFDFSKSQAAIVSLAAIFNVNPAVAKIRISEIYGDPTSQLSL